MCREAYSLGASGCQRPVSLRADNHPLSCLRTFARSHTITYETITVEQRGRVALLTLNRPEKLNAWTPQIMAELRKAMEAAVADAGTGAIVVTGAGRAFCAGADVGAVFKQAPTPVE